MFNVYLQRISKKIAYLYLLLKNLYTKHTQKYTIDYITTRIRVSEIMFNL